MKPAIFAGFFILAAVNVAVGKALPNASTGRRAASALIPLQGTGIQVRVPGGNVLTDVLEHESCIGNECPELSGLIIAKRSPMDPIFEPTPVDPDIPVGGSEGAPPIPGDPEHPVPNEENPNDETLNNQHPTAQTGGRDAVTADGTVVFGSVTLKGVGSPAARQLVQFYKDNVPVLDPKWELGGFIGVDTVQWMDDFKSSMLETKGITVKDCYDVFGLKDDASIWKAATDNFIALEPSNRHVWVGTVSAAFGELGKSHRGNFHMLYEHEGVEDFPSGSQSYFTMAESRSLTDPDTEVVDIVRWNVEDDDGNNRDFARVLNAQGASVDYPGDQLIWSNGDVPEGMEELDLSSDPKAGGTPQGEDISMTG